MLAGGDRLDGATRGDVGEQRLLVRAQLGVVGDGAHKRLHDRGVQHRAAGRDVSDGARQLVAFGHVVFQEVGVAGGAVSEERHGILRVVVLREDDYAGAGVSFAELLGRVDPLALKVGGHPDVGHEHMGGQGFGAGDELAVVAGGPDDREVGFESEQRPDAFAHDHVVVSQEDGDGTLWGPAVGHSASGTQPGLGHKGGRLHGLVVPAPPRSTSGPAPRHDGWVAARLAGLRAG